MCSDKVGMGWAEPLEAACANVLGMGETVFKDDMEGGRGGSERESVEISLWERNRG